MLISFQKKFIFVANTKTASSSIEAALAPYSDIFLSQDPWEKHQSIYDFSQHNLRLLQSDGHRFEDFFIFGVMRDPIEWIHSWFRYRKGNKVESPLSYNLSFQDFWNKKDWNIQRQNGRKFLQSDLFLAPDGRVMTDMILPYHNLAHEFKQLCASFGIAPKLQKLNESFIRPDHAPLSKKMVSQMQLYYERDYRLLRELDNINSCGRKRAFNLF